MVKAGDLTRATIFVGGVLLLAAVAVDEYLNQKSNGDLTYEFGAFKGHSAIGSDQTRDINCDDGNSECQDSCKSKKAFAIISVILAWLAVAVTTQGVNVLMATEDSMRTKISVVLTQVATISALIVLVMFGVEKRIPGTDDAKIGQCAYNIGLDGQEVTLGPSYILMIVGGALVGFGGAMQFVVQPGKEVTFSHMSYGNM